MHTKSHSVPRLRPALHLLLVSGLLLGLWAADPAHAEQKKDLIEMPLIKKFKEEKAAAEAEAAAAGSKPKPVAEKPVAKEAAPKLAAEKGAEKASVAEKPAASVEQNPALSGPAASGSVKQLREALSAIGTPSKQAAEKAAGGTAVSKHSSAHGAADAHGNRQTQRARALALARGEPLPPEHGGHGGEVHWAYEGENGPQAWGKLKPEFNLCAIGKRQSPIAIKDDATLLGPAEGVQFRYTPSTGTVVNNGHTIQVNLEGDNSITVRNSTYKLLQFHFHTPSEEMLNTKRYAMVAHLVHKNEAGQLAVVAVLLEQGEPNPLIDTVWTYMPLDTNDQVRMPAGVIDMNEILPADQRYYQFFGSLTTPPCTEGVLWMVMKQPLRLSPEQFRLFSQQFPFNARPVQALNGRPVREAK